MYPHKDSREREQRPLGTAVGMVTPQLGILVCKCWTKAEEAGNIKPLLEGSAATAGVTWHVFILLPLTWLQVRHHHHHHHHHQNWASCKSSWHWLCVCVFVLLYHIIVIISYMFLHSHCNICYAAHADHLFNLIVFFISLCYCFSSFRETVLPNISLHPLLQISNIVYKI